MDIGCFAPDKLFLMKTVFSPRITAVWRGRPGSSRDQDERSQEETHPRDGGVGRILNIIVQATPGVDASGGPVGEAAA